jgi:hypothetical protein
MSPVTVASGALAGVIPASGASLTSTSPTPASAALVRQAIRYALPGGELIAVSDSPGRI